MTLAGYAVRALVLCYMGGMIAYLYKDEKSPLKIFQLGLAAPALITAFINAHNVTQPVNAHESTERASIVVSLAYAQESRNDKAFKEFSVEETKVEQFWRGLTGSAPINVWFVIAGSHLKLRDAETQVKKISGQRKMEGFKPEVYKPYGGNPFYAVVIGANLTHKEAVDLKNEAIGLGFPKDIYLWTFPDAK